MKRTREIAAVLDEEIELVLERVGLTARLDEGTLLCTVCGDPTTVDSIGLVYGKRGKPCVVCDKDACMLKFTLGGQQ